MLRPLAACAWLLLHLAPLAHAQQPLRVALFKTAGEQANLAQLVAAADPVLHAELDKISGVTVVAQPALDLPSLQLALDCVGETPSCLAMAAERTGADALVAPTITRTDSALVLSLLLYQPAHASPMQVVTRRFASSVPDEVVLKGVASLLRELFGVAEPQAPTPAPVAPPEAAAPRPMPSEPEQPAERPSLVLPLVLGVAGAVFIGVGAASGAAAKSGEDRYAKQHVASDADARSALDRYDSAHTRATFANVAFGVGAAALAAGVIVFIVQRTGHSRAERSTAGTRVGVGLGRVVVTSTWN